MNNESYDLKIVLYRVKRFCVINIRWLTRSVMILMALLLLLHQVYAPAVDWIGEFFGMAKPSLASSLGLLLVVFILERVVIIEELIKQPRIRMEATRVKAYKRLAELVEERGAKKVALLQVSGHTVVRFLRDLAERSPKANVRLLLMRPNVACKFDEDHKPDHRDRILTTVREVELIETDFQKEGFKVQKKYYETPPGISAVVIDQDIVSISWYYCFKDPDKPEITRVRGHLAPTVTALSDAAEPLLSFALSQFDAVWATASDSLGEQAS